MHKLITITLFTLLIINNNLQGGLFTAGCWMPESRTVKNHYKDKDGGYVTIKVIDPKAPKILFSLHKDRKDLPRHFANQKKRSEYLKDMQLKEKLPQAAPRRKTIEKRWEGYIPHWEAPRGTFHLRLKGTFDRQGNFIPTGFIDFSPYKLKVWNKEIHEDRDIILEIFKKYWPYLQTKSPSRYGGFIIVYTTNKKDYPCDLPATKAAFEKWKKKQEARIKQQKEKRLKEAQKQEEYIRKIHT